MKLFFKHLYKSIRRHPLQPLILILTVMLSVAFSASTIALRSSVMAENAQSMEAQYGTADLTVSLNSATQSRFMEADRANVLLGQKGSAVGVFDLVVGLSGGERIFGTSADLHRVGDVFALSFTEYGSVNENNLSEALFITEALAERLGASLGETVMLEIFGVERAYRVAGISAKPMVGGKELLVDIRGVTRALSYHSSLVSALGDGFLPSTSLYVDLADGVSVGEGMDLLSSDALFADKTFTDIGPFRNNTMITISLNFIITAAVIVIALVSAAVIFSCFYILSVKRSGENAIFISAGARPAFMNGMQLLEAMLYFIFGAPLGLLLSLPLCLVFDAIAGFRYVHSALSPLSIAVSLLSALFAVLLTVFIFLLSRKSHHRRHPIQRLPLLLLAAILCCFLFAYIFGGTVRLVSGMSAICLLFSLVIVSSPIAYKKIANWLSDRLLSVKRKAPALLYALKNAANVKVLHNSARLISLMIVTLLCTVSLVLSAVGYSDLHVCMLSGEYAVTNPTNRLYEKLSADKSASYMRVYQQMGSMEGGYSVFVLAADTVDAFGEEMNIQTLPKENDTVLSSAVAKMLSAKVGDEITLLYEGKSKQFKVSEIVKAGMSFAVIDGAYQDVNYNLLLAEAESSGSDDALYERLTAAAASEMSVVFRTEELMASRLELLDVFLICGYILASALFIFALVGLLDNLYESYRHRRSDFILFSCAGGSKSVIGRMKLSEILYSILFGMLFGALIFIPIFLVFDRAAQSLNFEFIRCIMACFTL